MTEEEYDAMIEAELRKGTPPKAPRQPSPAPGSGNETDDAKIPVPCPGCGRTLKVPLCHIGRRVECKKCGIAFVAGQGAAPQPGKASEIPQPVNAGPVVSAAGDATPAKAASFDPKGLVIALVTLLVPGTILFLCCGGLSSEPQYTPSTGTYTPPSRETTIASPTDEVSETPGKAMVRRRVIVSPDISESELRTLLMHHYGEASAQGGFDYHQNPTVVVIYAYSSPAHEASGQWVGMLTKTPGDVTPQINIHPAASAPATNEERFGLTETQRKQLYFLIVQAEDRAWIEAESREPVDPIAQDTLSDQLVQRNRAELARRFGLTPAQLGEIGNEGLRKNWPMPSGR